MDDQAMQFLNLCANKAFGLIFTWLLGQPVKDTLCGTKVLTRAHYDRIAANRAHFGDFDPFGDFDLLFGAAKPQPRDRRRPHPLSKSAPTAPPTSSAGATAGSCCAWCMFAARKLKFV
jgi:hypothetical protein